MSEQDEKPMSLADKLKAAKAAKETDADDAEKPMSLAEKLKAQKEAAEGAAKPKPIEHGKPSKPDSPAPIGQHKKEGGLGASLAGSGLGSGTPLDEAATAALQATISELQQRQREMPGRVKLTGLISDISSLNNRIQKMPSVIADIRRRGYPYRDYLENKIEVFNQQWASINHEIKGWIARESDDLETELNRAESYFNRLNAAQLTTAQQNAAEQAAIILDHLEAKVEAAETHIQALYGELEREVAQTQSQLDRIHGYLEIKDEASFDFMAGETVYVADKAEWDNNNDKPDGYLYLTNQRLVFEQKEKTGKTLGLFGGKEVQKVLWEVPLNTIENAEPENKGIFGGKDMVHLQLGAGAPYPRITVEIKGGIDCKAWVAELKKMLRGEIGGGTIHDPELVERLRTAPTDCPTCGAVLPQLVAGQNALTCKYCGTVVRV